MSAEHDTIRQLAERIARRVGEPTPEHDSAGGITALSTLSASIRRLENRVAQIETHVVSYNTEAANRREHPSAEKFGVDETVSELVDHFERTKVCELEPGGKPCDHCSMCSSRGF